MSDISLFLYRNRKTKNCFIERCVGTSVVGKFVNVSAEEMRERGLEIISNCLNGEPPPNSEEKPERASYSKEEERQFYRLHKGVSIDSPKSGVVRIGPMRRKGSGHVVPKDEMIQLLLPCTNDAFLAALDQALE